MNLAIGSSYVALTSTKTECDLQRKNENSTKFYVRVGGYLKNGNAQEESQCNDKRVVFSSQLMPGHLEGSFFGRKLKPEEPSKELQFVRTLLIDNYDSYTYNIYQELSVINGVPPFVIRNDEWTWEQFRYFYEEKVFHNIVISPGPGSPTCASDIGICLRILLECRDIPILGVCLGHQALGYVHGAQIVHACEPVHGRLSEIMHNGCRLFHDIPSGPELKVVRYHSLVIDPESLPNDLVPIAWTSSTGALSFYDLRNLDHIPDSSKNHINPNLFFNAFPNGLNGKSGPNGLNKQMQKGAVLMGIMHATRPHYGVQFHPESIATCYGRKIFTNFREMTQEFWHQSRRTFINGKSVKHAACLQVPGSGSLFRVTMNGQLVCDEDVRITAEASTRMQILDNVFEKNPFCMLKNLDLSESSIEIKKLKLTWRRYNQMAKKVGGARNVFHKLFGQNKAQNTFWLDSSSVEKKRARFSFMGSKGGSLWKQMTFRLSEKSDMASKGGGYLSFEDAQGNRRNMLLENGFLDFLNQELQSFSYDEKDFEGLPFDFYGGYVGYFGYNLKVECGMSSNRHKSRTPDACFFFVDNFLVIDHNTDDVYAMSVREESMVPDSWLDDIEAKLHSLESSSPKNSKLRTYQSTTFSPCNNGFVLDRSREQYINDVQKCLEYIKDGESYELCFTTQMRKRIEDIDSLGLYFRLREKNPAPYAAWLNFSNENLCICCSSPERFLRLDRNGVLEAKPIKGTIARGATEQEDEQLKLQLQYSEKDRAENLMIVDLLRNDLGRVCEPGSVCVPHLMDVESYATVHTMVSTIRGTKRSNMNSVDCIRAAFPGGSMTGAPKLRSMELLDSLESCSRGIYSGSIGFVSYNQTFDLNIVIRTIVIHDGEASIGAGGAIVALSDPESEFNEMLLKTRAPAKAMTEFQLEEDGNC